MGRRTSLAWVMVWLLFFSCAFPGRAGADTVDVKGEAYILMDADSGKVLLAKNENKRLPPASMTKLMTLILAAQDLDEGKVSIKDKVVASENAWKMGGSQIYLEPGEEMSLEEMLIAIAVGSANDACVAVAEHLDGSHEGFVERMNRTAKTLGLKNTHFMNSYGLPADNHYSSAYDMAVMARYALQYPKILEYSSIKEYHLRQGEFELFNTNKLLWWYQGADGFKTGWTNEAKYCLTSTAKRDGLRLIAVVFASPETRGHFRDCMQLFNYGFARYSYKTFFPRGTVAGIITVGKGLQDRLEIVAEEDAGSICLKGEEKSVTYKKQLPQYVEAPITEGQKLGEISIYQGDVLQKKVNLVASRQLDRGGVVKEILKMLRITYML